MSSSTSKRKNDVVDLTLDDENGYQIPVKSKKIKKQKDVVEKRASRYLSFPSQKTQDRIDRALNQRLYLINQNDNSTDNNLSKDYAVLGSTGNVYNVTIAKYPSCTCPDSANCCKHILFVFLRVLKLDIKSPLIYQVALLQSELKSIFEKNSNNKDVLAKEAVIKAFNKSLGIETENDNEIKKNNNEKKIPILQPGSECVICFEEMSNNNNEKLECCKTCSNFIHFDCMSRWKKSSIGQTTCPFCRQLWEDHGSNKSNSKNSDDAGNEYLNFGSLQGQSNFRDTSTYSEYYDRWH